MDGSVTISLRNFIGEGIISKWIKQMKRYTNVSVSLRRYSKRNFEDISNRTKDISKSPR
jgi:hypothetical protein